jgi:hypothetical protein
MCLPLQTLGELPPHQALTREAAFFFKGKPPFILTEWRTFSGKFIFGVKEKQASPHKGTVEEDELQAWTVYTFQVTSKVATPIPNVIFLNLLVCIPKI